MAAAEADVVVLAAGRSSRMGEPKGLVLVPGQGGPRRWIDRQLEALQACRAGRAPRVVLVLGADRDRYLAAVADLAHRVVVVVNPDPDRGPFSSLQEGLAAVTPGAPVFVLPVDVPVPSPAVWAALAAVLEGTLGGGGTAGTAGGAIDASAAAVPRFEGKGGHPVLLGPAFVGRLRALPPSSRLDEALRALPAGSLLHVAVDDPAVRLNLNAPEDWGKVQRGG